MSDKGTNERSSRTSYLAVADTLRQMALDGTLEMGHRLPSEAELCETFGVSRTTLREALRILTTEQLITTKRGVHGGSIVTALAPENLADSLKSSLNHLIASRNCTMDELLATREQLEVPAARLAALRRSTAHLEQLQATMVHPDTGRLERTDFHKTILRAAGNRLTGALVDAVTTVLHSRYSAELTEPRRSRSFAKMINDDHAAIYELIASGDADGAAAAMSEHLTHLRSSYVRQRGRPGTSE